MNAIGLKQVQLAEIRMPLKHAFETSFGVTTERRIIIVTAVDESGAVGYGECTAMEQPLYNHESVDAAWTVIAGSICPMLAAEPPQKAEDVAEILSPIKGNRMSIAAIEMAIWDLEAKLLGIPLWSHLGGTNETINSGVSIGLQSSIDVLLEKVKIELDAGYQRIKLKIKPGRDLELVKAVRDKFGDILLSVDANSAYSLTEHADLFRKMDKLGLLMIEQPLRAGDLIDHAKLQAQLATPICLDESITSPVDARQAIEIGSCRIINIKLGRVGGHSAARAIQQFARESDIPVWCGGMLESGIGRAHNIAMSSLPGFVLPGDISASERYWDQDVLTDKVKVHSDGTINARSTPGIGYQIDIDRLNQLTVRTETIDLSLTQRIHTPYEKRLSNARH